MTILQLTLLVFFNQIIFIGLRTWNIRLIAAGSRHIAALSSCLIHMSWLVSVAVGATSMYEIIQNFELEYLPVIIGSTLGSIPGTYIGMKK